MNPEDPPLGHWPPRPPHLFISGFYELPTGEGEALALRDQGAQVSLLRRNWARPPPMLCLVPSALGKLRR